jgi:hypothetical protein
MVAPNCNLAPAGRARWTSSATGGRFPPLSRASRRPVCGADNAQRVVQHPLVKAEAALTAEARFAFSRALSAP